MRAARLTRSAPHARLEAVAETADVSVRALRKQLRSLPSRGGCSAAVAAVASRKAAAGVKAAGLSHQACPPPVTRLASEAKAAAVVEAGRGVAAWTGRRDPARMARSGLVGLLRHSSSMSYSARRERHRDAALRSPLATLAATLFKVAALTDVARNRSCPTHLLVMLSNSDNMDVRAAVCDRDDTPAWVLAAVAAKERSGYSPVRTAVAANPNTPPEALRLLAGSRWPPGGKLAANPSSPPDVIESLCTSEDLNVRAAAARHRACPTEALTRLAGDSEDGVRAAAAGNPNCLPQDLRRVVGGGGRDVSRAVAANPNCPEEMIVGFARGDDWNLRLKAASNASCPPEVLCALSVDEIAHVRVSAAANPSMPAEELDRLAQDAPGVRAAVATNPSTSPEALNAVVVGGLGHVLPLPSSAAGAPGTARATSKNIGSMSSRPPPCIGPARPRPSRSSLAAEQLAARPTTRTGSGAALGHQRPVRRPEPGPRLAPDPPAPSSSQRTTTCR